LIRQGFAKPLTIPPDVKYSEQFLEAGRDARINGRGLWGKC
jgi:micrococcal nuclease